MPGDPTPAPVASWVSHSPNIRPNSSLEEYMGTRRASQLKQVRGGGKGGGAGVQAVVGWVARMMGMTMIDSAMPDGGSSCDLVSPESGPNRAHRAHLLDYGRVTDKSAGPNRKRRRVLADLWGLLKCGIQLDVREPPLSGLSAPATKHHWHHQQRQASMASPYRQPRSAWRAEKVPPVAADSMGCRVRYETMVGSCRRTRVVVARPRDLKSTAPSNNTTSCQEPGT